MIHDHIKIDCNDSDLEMLFVQELICNLEYQCNPNHTSKPFFHPAIRPWINRTNGKSKHEYALRNWGLAALGVKPGPSEERVARLVEPVRSWSQSRPRPRTRLTSSVWESRMRMSGWRHRGRRVGAHSQLVGQPLLFTAGAGGRESGRGRGHGDLGDDAEMKV